MAVAWIDYRKAYDMVPHNWMKKSMDMFGVAVNVRSFVNASMKQWNTELTASNQRLGNVKIRRGIFQGDSLSPLLLVLVMIPLILVLRQTKASHEIKKGGKKINHLLFMDDLKLFAKNSLSKYSKKIFRGHQNGVWVTKVWGVDHEERRSS